MHTRVRARAHTRTSRERTDRAICSMLGAHKTALRFMLIQTATGRQDQEDNYQNVSDCVTSVVVFAAALFSSEIN